MARTVLSSFETFRSNLELTTSQVSDISTSHTGVRSYLRGQFTVIEDFLTGSYVRDTLIRQSRDVDFLLVLDGAYYNGTSTSPGYRDEGPAALLDDIRRSLKNKYTTTQDISRDGQAVTVGFTHIDIDVVPAFRFDAASPYYLIPNTKKGDDWLRTNPTAHQNKTVEMNGKTSGRFVPVTKMVKYWNYAYSYGYSGFFIEMFLHDICTIYASELTSYPSGVRQFFHHAIRWLDSGYSVPDTWSSQDLAPIHLPDAAAKQRMRSRLSTALASADKAIDANDKGDNETAIGHWRSVFNSGAAFPSYG